MKHVSEIQTDLGYAPGTESSRPHTTESRHDEPTAEDLVDLIYAAFGSLWGALWESRYGVEDADGNWRNVVQRLSPRQVRGGIELVRGHWDRDVPPTPQQFRKWAEDSVRPYDIVPEDRRIAVQPAEESVRDEHMAKIKAMLAGGSGEAG